MLLRERKKRNLGMAQLKTDYPLRIPVGGFFIQRLTTANFVTSSKSATETGGYLDPERIYKLATAGRDTVARTRAFDGTAGRRSRMPRRLRRLRRQS